ncbi:MAG: peptidylprolyl isomerase [bacterium]
MKNITLILALVLFFGCNKAETERLTTENEKLKNEKLQLEQKINDLQKTLAQSGPAQQRLKFLAGKLSGIKTRIVTNYGDIELSFFNEKAPIHCFNFITRAESGFYDNTKFHRIIKGFMIQGGDPNTKDKDPYNDGQGGPLVAIPHEFNDTPHKAGILSMARVGNTAAGAGSQFFIMHGDAPNLDGQYTAFGKVTKGMEIVNKIAGVKTIKDDRRRMDQPVKPVVIKTIEVYR